MTGIYLFEAKSIQSYLGRSGKLKNVVEVSDALSNLIDDTSSSKLYDVMKAAGLLEKSDLIDNKQNSSTEVKNNHIKDANRQKRRLPKLTPTGEWALVVFDNMARYVVVPEAFVVIVGACPLFLILK